VWDLSQIGVEQTPDDQEDGPPELMFIHGGAFLMLVLDDTPPTILDHRSHGTSLRLLLGAWGRRALDGSQYVGGQCGDGLAADYARLGWRGSAY
jgi:hypothetical protein